MQILVVVANTQARTLWAEVEKGFARTAVGRELVGPKVWVNSIRKEGVMGWWVGGTREGVGW